MFEISRLFDSARSTTLFPDVVSTNPGEIIKDDLAMVILNELSNQMPMQVNIQGPFQFTPPISSPGLHN